MYSNLDPTMSPSSPMADYKAAGMAGGHIQDTPSSSLVDYSMPEKNSVQGKAIVLANIFYIGFFQTICHFQQPLQNWHPIAAKT